MKQLRFEENHLFFSQIKLLEFVGAIFGIIGALMMAINPGELAYLAFPLWLVSSLSLTLFAFLSNLKYLLGLQLTFTFINVLGVINNF